MNNATNDSNSHVLDGVDPDAPENRRPDQRRP